MHFFVSYAREDKQLTTELVNDTRRLRHDVWMDNDLTGGQAWWGTILSEIRKCDGFLFVVSEGSLESQACRRELAYAEALSKTVIPVGTKALVPELLPPDLAVLQFIDFSSQNRDSAFQLAIALGANGPSPPLPDPLPAEPPVPVSYMSELTDRVQAPTLTLDEQFAILARLRGALERPREAQAAAELLERLQARHDLFYAVGHEITDLLGERATAHPESGAPPARPEGDSPATPEEKPPHAAATASADAASLPGGWHVEVIEQTGYARSLTVTRRQAHSLSFRINYKVTKGAVAHLQVDEMRIDEPSQALWQRFHKELKTIDGGEIIPVEVKAKLDYRGSIKSFLVRMGGVTVYEENRP